MKLSIIVVTHNSSSTIGRCLEAVFRELKDLKVEVFVVDNASSDDTAAIVKKFPPARGEVRQERQVKLIQNRENLGFAKANNIAIKQAQGEYILLLNPDTQVKSGSLEKLVDFAEKHPQVGIVSPKLLNPDGSIQREVLQFPTLFPVIMRLFRPYVIFPFLWKTWPLKEFVMGDFDYARAQEIPHLMGAAFLVKKEVFQEIGLYDENFFLWFEDTDFCLRAKKAGWKIFYFPEAEVAHIKSHTMRKLNPWQIQKIWNSSGRYYFSKHRPFWEQILLEPFLWLSLALMPPVMFLFRFVRHIKKKLQG